MFIIISTCMLHLHLMFELIIYKYCYIKDYYIPKITTENISLTHLCPTFGLVLIALGLIHMSQFCLFQDWSQNQILESSGICPKVVKNTNWEQSQIIPVQDIGTDPKTLLSSHLDQSQIHPVHDFGTDPNVPFFDRQD